MKKENDTIFDEAFFFVLLITWNVLLTIKIYYLNKFNYEIVEILKAMTEIITK